MCKKKMTLPPHFDDEKEKKKKEKGMKGKVVNKVATADHRGEVVNVVAKLKVFCHACMPNH